MKITIHRGANQIGGCITEIATEKAKVFIDFGCNLPGSKNEELTAKEVDVIAGDADAIFYSHYHGDHVGLHHLIPEHTAQYMGAGAIDVMRCKYNALNTHQDFSQQLTAIKRMIPFKERERIAVKNNIFVTPFFVSHSAFDAYMFLIECEGKRILHTGDFRRHGYLGKGLFPTVEKFIGKVDILITEGTMLGRSQEQVVTEHQIQLNTIQALSERKHKYVFALCSSTDIDRLASFHAACKKTGRLFLVDGYQHRVLDIFSKYSGSKSSLYKFDNVFELRDLRSYRIEKITNYFRDKGFLMPVRMNSLWLIEDMMQVFTDEAPWLLYSMWSGYAEGGGDNANENVIAIRHLFENRILDGVKDGFHTSGHADVATLSEICQAVSPSIGTIPIHKDVGANYKSRTSRVFDEGFFKTDGIEIEVH